MDQLDHGWLHDNVGISASTGISTDLVMKWGGPTEADRGWMQERGVARLITTTPRIGKRNFATNVLEAFFVSLAGKREALSEAEYLHYIREVNFHPETNEL